MSRSGARDHRFPRSVYDGGEDPDPRFSLANERTFLAWIRTALALMAAGLAIEALAIPMRSGLRLAVAVTLVAVGIAAAMQAWLTWSGTERALRQSAALPSSGLKLPITIALLVVGAGLLVGVLL